MVGLRGPRHSGVPGGQEGWSVAGAKEVRPGQEEAGDEASA